MTRKTNRSGTPKRKAEPVLKTTRASQPKKQVSGTRSASQRKRSVDGSQQDPAIKALRGELRAAIEKRDGLKDQVARNKTALATAEEMLGEAEEALEDDVDSDETVASIRAEALRAGKDPRTEISSRSEKRVAARKAAEKEAKMAADTLKHLRSEQAEAQGTLAVVEGNVNELKAALVRAELLPITKCVHELSAEIATLTTICTAALAISYPRIINGNVYGQLTVGVDSAGYEGSGYLRPAAPDLTIAEAQAQRWNEAWKLLDSDADALLPSLVFPGRGDAA